MTVRIGVEHHVIAVPRVRGAGPVALEQGGAGVPVTLPDPSVLDATP